VQDKHKQIKKLEASIIELHQLFVDMAVLVEAQGELVKRAHAQRDRTSQHVDIGESNREECD
jgi:syntaxin 1B/2/3